MNAAFAVVCISTVDKKNNVTHIHLQAYAYYLTSIQIFSYDYDVSYLLFCTPTL